MKKLLTTGLLLPAAYAIMLSACDTPITRDQKAHDAIQHYLDSINTPAHCEILKSGPLLDLRSYIFQQEDKLYNADRNFKNETNAQRAPYKRMVDSMATVNMKYLKGYKMVCAFRANHSVHAAQFFIDATLQHVYAMIDAENQP